MQVGTKDIRTPAPVKDLPEDHSGSRAVRAAAFAAVAALVCAQPGDNFHDAALKAAGGAFYEHIHTVYSHSPLYIICDIVNCDIDVIVLASFLFISLLP